MRPLLIVAVFACCCIQGLAQNVPQQQFRAVPFTAVQFDDAFWSPRLKTNREISIPHNYKWCEDTGRFTNFAKAAKLHEGNFQGIFYNDSDVYKLLEGTAYCLADHPDKALEKRADDVIAWIAAAQQPNGYLNSYYTLREPDKKWTNTHIMHELYCAGHLAEAAIAYKQATGKNTLLNVTEKFMDHVIDTFGFEQGKKVEVPGHEEIELALVKLYQLTSKQKYLDLAKFFIDVRGDAKVRTDKLFGTHQQDHMPVREQSEIVGHAVRAMYLYAGVADIAAYSGDKELIAATDRLWDDVVNKKMYITGGIGARHEGEAFGNAFELPNRSAYAETCAAIGLAFWAHRMNLLHGKAEYADVVERALYNGVLSGIGLDGKSFFYVNPLESTGTHHRQPFFSTACCPTNVVRFVPSLPGYQYVVKDNTVYVNQYIAGTATLLLQDGEVTITQKTNYPWDGKVELSITNKPHEGSKGEFKVTLRDPGWNRKRGSGEYASTLTGTWDDHPGESIVKVEEKTPMEPKRMIANPKVVANQGRVAIQRGPLVYCFEQCDNEVSVLNIRLARDPEFKEEFRKDLLGGVMVLKCKNADGRELTAIPYYAWDHREPGAMAVWVRQEGLSRTQPDWNDNALYKVLQPEMLTAEDEPFVPEPTVQVSHCFQNDSVEAIIDGVEPKSSSDHDIARHTFWNHRGTKEWVAIDFGVKKTVSKSSIYWFDDTGRGQCRVPKSWTLSYRDGTEWKPLKTADVAKKDAYDVVEFDAVETTGLRIDIQLQDGFSGGVLDWKVE